MISDSRRVVLVTGAAMGIGRAISRRFAELGDRVVLVDFNPEGLQTALRELGGNALGVAADVRDSAAVTRAVNEAAEHFGRLDVVVSNAAIYPNTPVLEMDDGEWERVIGTNLSGSFFTLRAAARAMVRLGKPGKLCAIASPSYATARIGAAHYCASKAGLAMLARVLALELAERRINVNVVVPGFVNVGERPGVSAEYRAAVTRMIPWGRTAQPDEIARVVSFVCSADAEFMTGAVVPVDGGWLAGRFELPRGAAPATVA
jgi:NAD(P)-dependent dehydrogenase (short-subunit alcohol dehydrogenase family)